MSLRPIRLYVSLMALLAGGVTATLDWAAVIEMSLEAKTGLAALLVLGLISESLTLSIAVGKKSGNTSSIVFLPLLTSILLFGPAPSIVLMGVTGLFGEFVFRKKEPIRAIFNSSQYVVSTAVAGWGYSVLGGKAMALSGKTGLPGLSLEENLLQLVSFIGFGVFFLFLNHAAVAIAITLSEGGRLRTVWARLAGRSGTNLVYDLLVSPIAIIAALLFLGLGVWGLPLIVLPLLFIRQAYHTILELQQANRDLLRALVKAIETRDPYTSGHSIRVMALASRIAEAMGLSPSRQQNVEQAALLHDIGKIEATYSEILRKPSGLTEEERQIIESHVAKGVELLQQLSSFSREVVEAVRSHHERVDGKGYPDGLQGDQIPIGARIIKVCDAIDAMLSDRPYRKALTLAQVREQLVMYAGIQFDVEVVRTAIQGHLLEAHEAEILLQRGQEPAEHIRFRNRPSQREART